MKTLRQLLWRRGDFRRMRVSDVPTSVAEKHEALVNGKRYRVTVLSGKIEGLRWETILREEESDVRICFVPKSGAVTLNIVSTPEVPVDGKG